MVPRDQAPSPESFPPTAKVMLHGPSQEHKAITFTQRQLVHGGAGGDCGKCPVLQVPALLLPPCNLKCVYGGKHSSSAGFSALPTSGGGCRLSPGTTSCSVSMCGCDQGTNPSELVVPDRQQRGNQRPEKGFFKRGKRRAALIPQNRKENLSKIKRGPVFSLSLSCSTFSVMLSQILLET